MVEELIGSGCRKIEHGLKSAMLGRRIERQPRAMGFRPGGFGGEEGRNIEAKFWSRPIFQATASNISFSRLHQGNDRLLSRFLSLA